jgi:hypothetical protein
MSIKKSLFITSGIAAVLARPPVRTEARLTPANSDGSGWPRQGCSSDHRQAFRSLPELERGNGLSRDLETKVTPILIELQNNATRRFKFGTTICRSRTAKAITSA